MTKRIILCALCALLINIGLAAPADALTNADAARLFVALRTTQAGLSASNTRNAALNINALRTYVEAYEAGQQVVRKKALNIAKNDPDAEAKSIALGDELAALSRQPVKISLHPLTLSDDELRDAKVPPDALAEFLRFLSNPKK